MTFGKSVGLGILAGLFLVFAYPPLPVWPLVFAALVPLFFVAAGGRRLESFGAGFAAGAVFFGVTLRWLLAAHPLRWAGVSHGPLSLLIVSATVLLGVAVLSLFFGLFVLFLQELWRRQLAGGVGGGVLFFLAPAALWVLLEYGRAWGFGLFWHGPGALLGPHWTFGHLGYALHDVPQLRILASLGGVYLLSFLVVLVNAALYLALRGGRRGLGSEWTAARVLAGLILGMGLWVFFGSLLGWRLEKTVSSSRQIRAALVTTNFPAGYSQNPKSSLVVQEAVLQLLQQALGAQADLVVFPEGSGLLQAFADRYGSADAVKEFFRTTAAHPLVLIDNGRMQPGPRSRLFYLDTERGFEGFYDKRFLMPGGEYFPWLMRIVAWVSGNAGKLDEVVGIRALEPGASRDVVIPTRVGKIGGLVCSGIIALDLARGMVKNGAELLVVVSSDSIFKGHGALLAQNEAMSQIRAVENGRAFLQATNGGVSYAIAPSGEMLARAGADQPVHAVAVPLQSARTLYAFLGNWIVAFSALVIAGVSLFLWRARRRPTTVL